MLTGVWNFVFSIAHRRMSAILALVLQMSAASWETQIKSTNLFNDPYDTQDVVTRLRNPNIKNFPFKRGRFALLLAQLPLS